jgi:hypothetical protein
VQAFRPAGSEKGCATRLHGLHAGRQSVLIGRCEKGPRPPPAAKRRAVSEVAGVDASEPE